MIILEDSTHLIQTLYLESDGSSVEIDESTGYIAVSNGCKVTVYAPTLQFDKPPIWSELLFFETTKAHGSISTLSWGAATELLTGSKVLALWSIDETSKTAKEIWFRE